MEVQEERATLKSALSVVTIEGIGRNSTSTRTRSNPAGLGRPPAGPVAINLILDLVVLVPLMGASARDYVYDIGLRYLLIPIIAASMGAAAERAASDVQRA